MLLKFDLEEYPYWVGVGSYVHSIDTALFYWIILLPSTIMMNNTKITKRERAGDNQDTYLCGSAMSLYTQESAVIFHY
jgi:hypothetical protein